MADQSKIFVPGNRVFNLRLIGPATYPRHGGGGVYIKTNKYVAECLGDSCTWKGEVYKQYVMLGTRKGRCCGRPMCDPGKPKHALIAYPVGHPLGWFTIAQNPFQDDSAGCYIIECINCDYGRELRSSIEKLAHLSLQPCPGCGFTFGEAEADIER